MAESIKVDYPKHLANSMRLNKDDFGNKMKISALIKLFELGKVSSDVAAKALKISRVEFLDLLAKYKVGYLDVDNLKEDLESA